MNQIKVILIAIVATALMLIAAPSAEAVASISRSRNETSLITEINRARMHGRMCGTKYMPAAKPLAWNWRLGKAAHKHSADMAARGYFSHFTPEGVSPFTRIRAVGYSYRAAGENLAAGRSLILPAAAVKAWLKSPGHCKVLMNPVYRDIGAGQVLGGHYGNYWTTDFGRKKT